MLVALALAIAAHHAPAAGLRWSAPAECPDDAAVAERVRARLPPDASMPEADLVVEKIEGGRYRLRARFGTGDNARQRSLEGADCASVTEAAVFLTAAAASGTTGTDPTPDEARAPGDDPPLQRPDPWPSGEPTATQDVAAAETRTDANDEAATEVEAKPEPDAPRTTDTRAAPASSADVRPRRPASLRGLASGGVGLSLLTVPAPTASFHLAVAVGGRRWEAALGGLALLPRGTALQGDVGVSIGVAGASASGCGIVGSTRLEVPLCGAFLVGAITGRGRGVRVSRRARAPWLAAAVRAGIRYWVHPRVALGGQVEGSLNILRPQFEVRNLEPSWIGSPGGLRFAVGVTTRFAGH